MNKDLIYKKIIFLSLLLLIFFNKESYAEIKIENIDNNSNINNQDSNSDLILNSSGNNGNLSIDKNLLYDNYNNKIKNFGVGLDLGLSYKIKENYIAKFNLFKIKTLNNYSNKNTLLVEDIFGIGFCFGKKINKVHILPSINFIKFNFANEENSVLKFDDNPKIGYGLSVGYELFPSLIFQINYLKLLNNKKMSLDRLYKYNYSNIYLSIAYNFSINN
jgi:hypothetical protein